MTEKLEKKVERKSNFELLRIISMMMIFVYHYCLHGGVINLGSYTTNKLVSLALVSFGRVGVNIFILLSGYFLINSDFKIKKLLKLIFQVLFYAITLALIYIYRMNTTFEAVNFKVYLLPIYNGIYWFATCYANVYLFSPFLNKMIKSISKKDSKKIIILGLLILSVIPLILFKNNIIVTEIVWYVFIYFIGAEIRINDFKLDKKYLLLLTIGYPIISFIIMIGIILIGKKLNMGLDYFYFSSLNSVFVFLGSIGYFMLFKNLNIKNNKIINYFAKISFATYLISDHTLYRNVFWHVDCKTKEYILKPVVIFLVHILSCIVVTWIIVAIIEFIRIYVFEKLIFKIKCFDKIFEKIDNWMNT